MIATEEMCMSNSSGSGGGFSLDQPMEKFEERLKDLAPAEREAVRNFWRSVVMRTPRAFSEENGRLAAHGGNVRSCNCCPYGYHIDLDFVRYCESLANAKPSEEELRRRSRRRSRKSMEFMLGLDGLFDQWDAAVRTAVQSVPEAAHESDSPDSLQRHQMPPSFATSTPCPQQPHARPRSSSMPRIPYGGNGVVTRSDSPFGTASSTCSSVRGGTESDSQHSQLRRRPPTNSPPETKAFLHDALDEVCSDFERTLERTSQRRKKPPANLSYSIGSMDRNNNDQQTLTNGFGSWMDKRSGNAWDQYSYTDGYDSCVSGNKSPRSSRVYSKTLPFQQRLSPAEQQYEQYVQATVAANSKSPVEELLLPKSATDGAPPPPPRRHALNSELQSKFAAGTSPLRSSSEGSYPTTAPATTPTTTAQSPGGHSQLSPDAGAADPQALFNIRQQMALSLKRMKDLEEQVKAIPELEHELSQIKEEKQRLQSALQRKEEELLRARESSARYSSTPSPVASPKFATNAGTSTSGQFTPQRISPISLESLGSRLRTNSSSSDKQSKAAALKRDVATMCGLHATRDIGVGSPVPAMSRSVGTSPSNTDTITDVLYTSVELSERITQAIKQHDEQRESAQAKRHISVGTQMYIPKKDIRNSGVQTSAEKPILKYSIGVMALPKTRDNFVTCKPDVRSVGSSEDRIGDILCETCSKSKRTVACGTDETLATKSVSLKLLDSMPGRSNTFSLGEGEKLPIKRKTQGTQYQPVQVLHTGSQTLTTVVRSVGLQNSPETASVATQDTTDQHCQYTDTRDLIFLARTVTSAEEIASPQPPKPEKIVAPPRPETKAIACNTESPKTAENGSNTHPPVTKRSFASNTEEINKRDIGCGDIVKPHISIACAANYCDSCKDAIKNLAKDFTKGGHTPPSPVSSRVADSKMPPSPSPLPSKAAESKRSTPPSPVFPRAAESKKTTPSSPVKTSETKKPTPPSPVPSRAADSKIPTPPSPVPTRAAESKIPTPPSPVPSRSADSKIPTPLSPVPTRAVESKIPRPKQLPSPSPVRRQFQRQNTYTVTPSPSPSPTAEKKSLISSLTEKPPAAVSFHQTEVSSESQSFISEPTRQKSNLSLKSVKSSPTKPSKPKDSAGEEQKPVAQPEEFKRYDISGIGQNDLIVREEKRVSINWSRDASPVPPPKGQARTSSPSKLDSSFNEKLKESLEKVAEDTAKPAPEASSEDTSKGARKKLIAPSKSSQPEEPTEGAEAKKPPTKAMLNKLAMAEAEPRQKFTAPKEMLSALKNINESLLKKMNAKPLSSVSLKAAKATIQQEWFRVSSTDKANPHEVEDYVDCFEEMSIPLLEYCVNLVDANGNTAMHYAVSHGNFDVVSILLDSKVCNVNQMNNAGYTCVMLVSLAKLKSAEHRIVVERLFQMADVNIRAKKHCQTALMLAVSHGNLDMVEMLLAAGADINIQDEDGSTALMCAAEHGRIEIVKHLLSQSECNSLIQDMDGSTAFKIAWQAGNRDIGLLVYVHEQMLRSKLPNRGDPPLSLQSPVRSPRLPLPTIQHKRKPSK